MAEFSEQEKAEIDAKYPLIIDNCEKCRKSQENIDIIRKAFDLANNAHYGMRRKSGEPYIHHPIEVARIVAQDIGLGTKSVVCALMHDVVEDTDYTLEDITNLFDSKVSSIIDGLTKMKGALKTKTQQAENFRKMVMTLSEDVRVILIKLADRLHNMRTLDSMPREKQLKISLETQTLFAPLAHRLGLYAIKTELEDLCLKYQEPKIYTDIKQKLADSEEQRQRYLNRFLIPLMMRLERAGYDYQVSGRVKSIASIWNKIKTKNVAFEHVYDIFAIRIILTNISKEEEKTLSWQIYSIITDLYQPHPDRLRDWISTPKANGYEALHTTVMGPGGRWVEVQIRSQRMDEIAERGYAAHWKYKGQNEEGQLDQWMNRLRDTLSNPDKDAIEFLDEFKMNLYASEIYVFTPTGELKRMPVNSTVLDFAYEIHTAVGNTAVGAKINSYRTVPLDYKLTSGDQVQIITSDKQKPQHQWSDFVITAKAQNALKQVFRAEKRNLVNKGMITLDNCLKRLSIEKDEEVVKKLINILKVENKSDLFLQIGIGKFNQDSIKDALSKKRDKKVVGYWRLKLRGRDQQEENNIDDGKSLVIDENFMIAQCCAPIPGDKIVGFKKDDVITIHKYNCEKAIVQQIDRKADIVEVKWVQKKRQAFLVRLKIKGTDRIGIISDISGLLSGQLNINMRTFHFETIGRQFEGYIDLYTHDSGHLNLLLLNIQKVKGVKEVFREEQNVEEEVKK